MPRQIEATYVCDKCGVTTAKTTAPEGSPMSPLPEGWVQIMVVNPGSPPLQYYYDPTCAAALEPTLVKA